MGSALAEERRKRGEISPPVPQDQVFRNQSGGQQMERRGNRGAAVAGRGFSIRISLDEALAYSTKDSKTKVE